MTTQPTTPAAPSARPRPYRLAKPAGLAQMRARTADRPAPIRREQVVQVLAAVRAGQALPEVTAAAELAAAAVLDIVAGVGSRLAQMHKRGPKTAVTAVIGGAARPSDRAEVTVLIPAGFEPTAPHGRDVTRALAAIALADPASEDRAIDRWLAATQPTELPVEYIHLTHWHFLAEHGTPGLDSDLFDVDFQDACVRAFDLLAAEAAAAVAALARIMKQPITKPELATAADTARWLSDDLDRLATTAADGLDGDAVAEQRLARMLPRLRASVADNPGRYVPGSLAEMSRDQVRFIAARHGMRREDIPEGTTNSRNLDQFADAVAAALASMAA